MFVYIRKHWLTSANKCLVEYKEPVTDRVRALERKNETKERQGD